MTEATTTTSPPGRAPGWMEGFLRGTPWEETPWDETPAAWVLLGIVLLVATVYWSLQYQPYILPNSDYFRIKASAEALMAGQLPGDLKQMPLVPLLIGPLAWMLPMSEDPYLHAISILNIALSVANLGLFYLLARKLLGGMLALVPVILLLGTPQFTVSALQPMLEPTIGFFSLATLVALAHHSRWAYAMAGACALVRYELSVLLAVVFLVETVRNPRQWWPIGLKCLVAGLPFLVWFGMSMLLPAEGNPYFEEMVQASFWTVASGMQSPMPASRPLLLGFLALAWTVGLYTAFRRNRSAAIGTLAFFLLYATAHVVYGRALPRYGYAVLWFMPLLATVAVHEIFLRLRPLAGRLPTWLERTLPVLAAAVAGVWILRTVGIFHRQFPGSIATAPPEEYLVWSFILLGLLTAAVYLSGRELQVRRRLLTSLTALVLASMPLILGGRLLASRAAGVYYEKSELVLAAEWLAHNLPDGERVVMPQRGEVLDTMTKIDLDRVVLYSDFAASDFREFVHELDARGITYAAFVHRSERPTDPTHRTYPRNIQNYMADKIFLMDPFREGGEVPGFHRVGNIPPVHPDINRPTYIYRRVPEGQMSEPAGDLGEAPRLELSGEPATGTEEVDHG